MWHLRGTVILPWWGADLWFSRSWLGTIDDDGLNDVDSVSCENVVRGGVG